MVHYSLKDLSIILSIKIDSQDRLKNIFTLLDYLHRYFYDKEIIIIEQGEKSFLEELILKYKGEVFHHFIQSSYAHNKTSNLNLATSLASRSMIMMIDADVICPPQSILKAMDKLKSGSNFISPHNGLLVQIKKHLFNPQCNIVNLINDLKYFPKDYDLNLDKYDFTDFEPLYGNSKYDSTGGCLIYNRRASILIGGWNENIISYGFEDMEFVYRISKFGYELEKMPDVNIYHLEHERNADSIYNNFYRSNEKEWNHVTAMTVEHLRFYVNNGFKEIRYESNKEIDFVNTDVEFSIKMKSSNKIDLSEYSILLDLTITDEGQLNDLNNYLDYLETHFNQYEVIMVEHGSSKCKYLLNKKNIKYHWCGFTQLAYGEVMAETLQNTSRKYLIQWEFDVLPEPGIIQQKKGDFEESIALRKYDIINEGQPIKFFNLSTK